MSTTPRVHVSERAPADLASALAQMSQVLLAVQSVDTVVDLITTLAVETLAETVGAGVSLIDEQGKQTRSASNVLVERADQLQYEHDDGPCIAAWRHQAPVRIDDISVDDRWPDWTAAVTALGVRSMLSVPLLSAGRSMGAIKVYSDQPGAYVASSVRVLTLFAEQASILLSNMQIVADARKLTSQLTSTLAERDIVGHAAGILLVQGSKDIPTALQTLRSGARIAGTSLPTFAHGLIESVMARPDRQST